MGASRQRRQYEDIDRCTAGEIGIGDFDPAAGLDCRLEMPSVVHVFFKSCFRWPREIACYTDRIIAKAESGPI